MGREEPPSLHTVTQQGQEAPDLDRNGGAASFWPCALWGAPAHDAMMRVVHTPVWSPLHSTGHGEMYVLK